MLHIKDIEAFARINEALSEGDGATPAASEATAGQAATGDGNDPAAVPSHPALVMAMVATGRLPLSALPKGVAPSPVAAPLAMPWNRMFRRR